MMKRVLLTFCCMLFVMQSVLAAPIFKANDRLVIYGDSITEQRMYSRYMQQYLFCRYPELKLNAYNAGWGGDRAPGGLNRLERDVLVLNPNVVTLFFGMNDGGYNKLNDDVLKAYKDGTEGIIKALQAKNVMPVVFTPGCVDPDKQASLKTNNYNDTLEALGKAALELAKQYQTPSADIFHPMLALQNEKKAVNPAFSYIPDSVHPDGNGHQVMAYNMLKGLGAEPMPDLGSADLKANTTVGLKVLGNTDEKITLETDPLPIPYWFEPAMLPIMRESGFLQFAGQKLTLTGLTAPSYELTVDGTRIGRISAEQLAAGYLVPGFYSVRGKLLHDMVQRKESNYFTAWRELRLPMQNDPAAKEIVDTMMFVDNAYHNYIHTLTSTPAKISISLRPLGLTANLAEGMKYVSSNPNLYNWGTDGLTDGSWEGSSTHCFASNDDKVFPKFVTVDLEKPVTISSVIAGVPAFGSTHTIAVSVSVDGKTFTDVGTYDFSQNKEERHTYKFDAVEARYVRLTYPNYYEATVGYNNTFVFTSELEVYAPAPVK